MNLFAYFGTQGANGTQAPIGGDDVLDQQQDSNQQQEDSEQQEGEVQQPPEEHQPPAVPHRDRHNDTWEDIPLLHEKSVHEHGRKSTGIVKEQMKFIMLPRPKTRAKEQFAKGVFWTETKKHSTRDIHNCWSDFFQLRVFNWFPDERMPRGWKLSCPNCGFRCQKYGQTNKPRLIYGMFENYILNAPQRYLCMNCKERAHDEECRGIPQNRRTQYTFLSTEAEVLVQIEEENPSLMLEFPCILSAINGLDKDLMELVIFNASKSIGPSAMAGALISFHEKRWNEKEIKWAAHLKSRISQPSAFDRPYDRDEVQKCPSYFSEAMCGSTPSSKYLVLMFNRRITARRRYYDSEVLKRIRMSSIISLDAHYKVSKFLMRHGKEKMYDALHSMLNEYGHIVGQKWSNGDSHEEIEENLKELHSLGLNPQIAFTDNPERDRSMLQRVFPKLCECIDEDAFRQVREEASSSGNPVLPVRGRYLYLHKVDAAEAALQILMQALDECESIDSKKVSVDAEWPVFLQQGTRSQGKLNHFILSSDVHPDTLILELYSIGENEMIRTQLCRLFQRDDVVFIGCCHKGDITRLRNGYPRMLIPQVPNSRLIDIRSVAISRGVTKRGLGKTTLQHITHLCGRYLPKDSDVRIGETFNSRNGALENNKTALTYMQRDGEAPLYCWNHMKDMPVLNRRMTPADVEVGQIVDILPSSLDDTDPIAIGKIELLQGIAPNLVNLSVGASKRCCIKVLTVLRSNGIIHFPRSGNGRQRCSCRRFEHGSIDNRCDFFHFHQLGKAPFYITETVSRLRLHENQKYAPVDNVDHDGDDTVYQSSGNEVTENDDAIPTNNEPDTSATIEGVEENTNFVEQAEIEALNDVDNNIDNEDESRPLRDLELNEEQLEEINDTLEDDIGLVQDEDTNADMDVDVLTAGECELGLDNCNPPNHQEEDNSVRAQQILYSTQLQDLIAKIDQYDYAFQCHRRRYTNVSDEDDNVLPDKDVKLLTRVLGDAFHVMDRIKVPMHHDYKPAFFRAMRAAILILNPDDVNEVKIALGITTEKSWNKFIAFRFKYIAQRVRRRIPDPEMLYERLKVVFDYFGERLDAKTKKPLFNTTARQKANAVLVMVKSGLLSDPPGYSFYVRRYNKDGTLMVDKHGLQLYRSIRGTSNLESLHETLTSCFGHTFSGAWYSDCLLTLVRHQHNWNASLRNDRNFPKLHHYDGTLIDKVNDLYEFCFGRPKYPTWVSTNDSLCTTSPFGVIRVDGSESEDVTVIKNGMFTSTSYIAYRQGSAIAYLPVKGVVENTLFRDLILDAVANGQSLGAGNTFHNMANEWNMRARGAENGIYKKQVIHLVRKFKSYRKTRSKEDAINNPDATKLLNAVEHIPPTTANGSAVQASEVQDEFRNFEVQDVEDGTNDAEEPVVDQVGRNITPTVRQPTGINKRKMCDTPGCIERFGQRCPKKYSKWCLLLEEQGVPQQKLKRAFHIRKCGNCKIIGCPAHHNRSKCWSLPGNGPAP